MEGKEIYSQEKIPKGSKEFWQELFGSKLPDRDIVNHADSVTIHENVKLKALIRPITPEEVQYQINKLKDSAMGQDDIARDTIKKIDPAEWAAWFNVFMRTGCVPRILKKFRLKLIAKKQGAILPSEFRPINIGSMVRRLYGAILAQRFKLLETSIQ